MVQRLSRTLLLTLLLSSLQLAAAPATPDNWHYRQAAWAFYLQQPAQALETLQLAKSQDPRTALLEAGLYLQLAMPQHAAQRLRCTPLRATCRACWKSSAGLALPPDISPKNQPISS